MASTRNSPERPQEMRDPTLRKIPWEIQTHVMERISKDIESMGSQLLQGQISQTDYDVRVRKMQEIITKHHGSIAEMEKEYARVKSDIAEKTRARSSELAAAIGGPYRKHTETEPGVTRPEFKRLAANPELLAKMPTFSEKIIRIREMLEKDPTFFDAKNIKPSVWKSWNLPIAKAVFPDIPEMSDQEAEIVIRSLQTSIKSPVIDGKFGPNSRIATIRFGAKQAKNALAPIPDGPFEKITKNSLSARMKRGDFVASRDIQRREKEGAKHVQGETTMGSLTERLRWLLGIKYSQAKRTDCSGILLTAMKDLGVIPKDLGGDSKFIIDSLTKDKRSIKDLKPGDFVFWKNARGANHIAYVSNTDSEGVHIIDSSTDKGKVAERFIPWRLMAQKRWFAGKPRFYSGESGMPTENV